MLTGWKKTLCQNWLASTWKTTNVKFNTFSMKVNEQEATEDPDVLEACWDLLIEEGIQQFGFLHINHVFDPTFPLAVGDLIEVPLWMTVNSITKRYDPWFVAADEILQKLLRKKYIKVISNLTATYYIKYLTDVVATVTFEY